MQDLNPTSLENEKHSRTTQIRHGDARFDLIERASVSLMKIDYVIRGYTGAMGTYAITAMDSIIRSEDDEHAPRRIRKHKAQPPPQKLIQTRPPNQTGSEYKKNKTT